MEPFDPEDPQEIELGMDTYCLVVDPGQATYYGGVRECEIKAGVLRLLLTCEAAQTLGLPTEALFRLELPTAEAAVLSVGLSRVLSSGRANERPILLDLSYHID
jgi:hypothetical protein